MKEISINKLITVLITLNVLLIFAAFLNDKIIKDEKQKSKLEIGQFYGNNIDRNPFEQDTIVIIEIKQDFVLYKYKSNNKRESCSIYDFKESDLYLIKGK